MKSTKTQNPGKQAKTPQKILLAIFLLYIALFYAQQVNFAASDLGRHIRNGELFFAQMKPLSTNYYSYTEPEHPAIAHHWGAGVVYYSIWKALGFEALSVFNMLLIVFAVYFLFRAALEYSSYKMALFLSFISVPLLTFRTEIRPEMFSYLFFGLYYYLIALFQNNRISPKKMILIMPVLQALWVNLHIFFIMGLFITGTFWFGSLVNKNRKFRHYSLILLLSIAACFASPFGVSAFLEPFLIFNNYGYMTAENQPVLFMQGRFPDAGIYYYFELMFLVSSLCLAYALFVRRSFKKTIPQLIMFIFFSALAWNVNRAISIFGFFLLPMLAYNAQQIADRPNSIKQKKSNLLILGILAAIILSIPFGNALFNPVNPNTGLGLMPGSNNSADFFKKNSIQGPVFNNYDIGGYLIFHLFPQQRVFTDNRPEAYSASFFQDIYIPMQEKEEAWNNLSKKYGINAIYFYRHDYTPWAQPFLIERIRDPGWAPVYVDDFAIILLKRNQKNQRLISKYELPESVFRIMA